MNSLIVMATLAFISTPAAWFDCGSCTASKVEAMDIVDTAVSAGSFNTLAAALQAAGLVDTLKGSGPFTVFAPTDEAFAKLPKGTVETLLKPENKDRLVSILTYHVTAGAVPAKNVVNVNAVASVNGQRLSVKADTHGVRIGNAEVVKTDIECSNGIIHVIDEVLLPSDMTIVETAAKAGTFKTLIAACQAAGLDKALMGDGPYTVFAPTDKAFAALPEGTVENLLRPENKGALVAILKYHVVAGRVYSDQALQAKQAKTLEGRAVSIRVQNGKPLVEDAGLVALDLDTSNGVIHVIDTVLLPPDAS